ncbi:aspartate/glutamate racemase family protein [Nocardioides mangrovi]|uniref:Aspartate/glutamate racemase family protein n=1 Tax=Nocardioides mangrovi TaxID=2874580 RepID=A0ABS7UCD7_9ACTN|nr:aspartate/glutamate racemase family protein [Nocardioides mangrovi]MBZ5738664.1 aspartate/glutamate racemase family protein [Nocardioides mangrovi]
MTRGSALGFLHTAEVHVATFDDLVGDAAVVAHVVEPDLLERARRDGLTPAVEAGLRAALVELVDAGADLVVCTCSTLGPLAETVDLPVPVLRVDRPMAARAVALGSRGPGWCGGRDRPSAGAASRRRHRIGVVAAVESTLVPTRELLADEAARAGVAAAVSEVCVPSAWALFEAGDTAAYLGAIADAARTLTPTVDVVVLAQASMAGAVDLLADLAVPVLVSPPLAVAAALREIRRT